MLNRRRIPPPVVNDLAGRPISLVIDAEAVQRSDSQGPGKQVRASVSAGFVIGVGLFRCITTCLVLLKELAS